MKNINKIYLYAIAMVIVATTSCKKQLEINPAISVSIERALSTRENLNAAIIGVYARLKGLRLYGRDMFAVGEALSENGLATNKSGRLINEAANVPGAHFGTWQSAYFAIAEINIILNAIPSLNVTPAVTIAERNGWEGELLFLRALLYHDLVRIYGYEPGFGVAGQDRGGVPIVTQTPLTIEAALANTPGRASVDSVYSRIYADLNSAITRLSNPASFAPGKVTLAAAQALFARVALYNRDYNLANTMATSVLTAFQPRIPTAGNYVGSWTSAVHPESIFEVRYANQAENLGVNESLQTTYTTLRDRGNPNVVQGFGDLVAQTSLLTQLGFTGVVNAGGTFTSRSDDARNLLFERGSTARGTARIECTKFIGKNGFPNLDNVPVIRVSEVLLTRAEARANATNANGTANLSFSLANATADLVALKTLRYAAYATTQAPTDATLTTAPLLLNEIYRQRRIELAFEGHRWFDFKRLGPTSPINPQTSTKIIYTDFRMLPPIPQREIDNNPAIIQNFNY